MQVRAQGANEFLDVVNIVMQVERAFRHRHHTGVGPVRDVDVVFLDQFAHGFAQQRRMMAGQGCYQQHHRLLNRIAGSKVFLEVQQTTKRLFHRNLLKNGHGLAVNGRRSDIKRWFLVILAEAEHQFVSRGDALGERRVGKR